MKREAKSPPSDSVAKSAKLSLKSAVQTSEGSRQQAEKILTIEAGLLDRLEKLPAFTSKSIVHVYNPLIYAAKTHQNYVKKWGGGRVRNLFVGMNPGPFGMSQNGVPFGDTRAVREWLKIEGHVLKPPLEHPKRQIEGLDCQRAEVSGTRFWGLMEEECGAAGPAAFFQHNFVYNYCPLAFLTATGANVTPDKLAGAEKKPLLEACDEALGQMIALLKCDNIVCVGKFAMARARAATLLLGDEIECNVCTIIHPSPASPQANKGWKETAKGQLEKAGVRLLGE